MMTIKATNCHKSGSNKLWHQNGYSLS